MPLPHIPESWKEPFRPYYLKWFFFLFSRLRPAHFETCWRYPLLQPGWPDAPRSGAPDVLILPMSDWHARMQRTQHLALGLAALGHRCFYLSPHLGREFPGVYSRRRRMAAHRIHERIAELHVHLPREPVYHHRLLTSAEETEVADALRHMLREAECERPLILVSFPGWTGVARHLKGELSSPVIYDCHDLIEGFDNVSPPFLREEKLLLELSDLVLFTAEWLRDEKLRQLAGTALPWEMLRNAATPSDFLGVRTKPEPDPVTIGYAGALSSWFDSDALEAAAIAHPEWRFLLIGRPEASSLSRLRRFENIAFPGEVRYEELPGWFSRMDVGIIPFRRMPLTMATNPVKLYEYLASGLPVVSADLPEVALLGPLVSRYRTPGEFVLQLESAVRDGRTGREARIAAVQGESWSARCDALHRLLLRLSGQSE